MGNASQKKKKQQKKNAEGDSKSTKTVEVQPVGDVSAMEGAPQEQNENVLDEVKAEETGLKYEKETEIKEEATIKEVLSTEEERVRKIESMTGPPVPPINTEEVCEPKKAGKKTMKKRTPRESWMDYAGAFPSPKSLGDYDTTYQMGRAPQSRPGSGRKHTSPDESEEESFRKTQAKRSQLKKLRLDTSNISPAYGEALQQGKLPNFEDLAGPSGVKPKETRPRTPPSTDSDSD